jgi:hypothetical protein
VKELWLQHTEATGQQFATEIFDELWLERVDYKEVASQLLLMAFLQCIINGGRRIEREYALGRKRMDRFIEWPWDHKLRSPPGKNLGGKNLRSHYRE